MRAYAAGLIGAIAPLTLLMPLVASGQCVNYEDYLGYNGFVAPGKVWDITVSGDLAYVVAEEAGLLILDVSNPESVEIIGSIDTPERPTSVALSGRHAYVTAWDFGLYVVDVLDPTSPSIVGHIGGQLMFRVAVSGSLAYVVDVIQGLMILDVSDPTTPSLLSRVLTPLLTWDVAVSGDYAYLVDDTGFLVVDVSDAAAPEIAGTIPLTYELERVALFGSYAYVTRANSGLAIIDISNPESPTIAVSLERPFRVRDLDFEGSSAWVTHLEGLSKLDLSDPLAPSVGPTYDTEGGRAVAIAGRWILVARDAEVVVVDTSIPPPPPALISSIVLNQRIQKMLVSEGVAYVGTASSGVGRLHVLDVSIPESPTILGEVDTPGEVRDLQVQDDRLYATNWEWGLQVVDISDPIAPTIVGSIDTPGWAGGVAVSDEYAYVGGLNYGLHIVNVFDPTQRRRCTHSRRIGRCRSATRASRDRQRPLALSGRRHRPLRTAPWMTQKALPRTHSRLPLPPPEPNRT
ncbi:MAG: hypothetical protein DHS20C21_07710 [Gemmatimonadota bacterium]|nr:MAG: hypothetical protein DHS20C21_07710 [Gemmatimonadota bacterium]